jgi:2-iminobutanoate/2-iminopropanoate deaminase
VYRAEINTLKAAQPTGPFAQAIKAGNLFFCAFRGIDPETNQVVAGDFRAEARQVLENIKAVVEAGGGTMANVVATTVYVRDMFRFRPVVNELYKEYFGENLPTRTIVEISRLNGDGNVEITATAWIP